LLELVEKLKRDSLRRTKVGVDAGGQRLQQDMAAGRNRIGKTTERSPTVMSESKEAIIK
jgi:hypothetical protein